MTSLPCCILYACMHACHAQGNRGAQLQKNERADDTCFAHYAQSSRAAASPAMEHLDPTWSPGEVPHMTSPFSAAAADASPIGCGVMISSDDLPLCRWLQFLLCTPILTWTSMQQAVPCQAHPPAFAFAIT